MKKALAEAEELASRIRAALEQLPWIAENKKSRDREKARASTTDADARVMKMVDGGFVKKDDTDEVSPPQGGTTVYAPVMESNDPNRDPHTPRDDDSPAVAEWRQRIGADEAKEVYRQLFVDGGMRQCVGGIAVCNGSRSAVCGGRERLCCGMFWFLTC